MLVLRKEQITAFSKAAENTFFKKVRVSLQNLDPDRAEQTGVVALDELIRKTTEKARQYGITSEWGVMQFCKLTFQYGFDFDIEYPDVKMVFETVSLDRNARMELLEEYLKSETAAGQDERPEGS